MERLADVNVPRLPTDHLDANHIPPDRLSGQAAIWFRNSALSTHIPGRYSKKPSDKNGAILLAIAGVLLIPKLPIRMITGGNTDSAS